MVEGISVTRSFHAAENLNMRLEQLRKIDYTANLHPNGGWISSTQWVNKALTKSDWRLEQLHQKSDSHQDRLAAASGPAPPNRSIYDLPIIWQCFYLAPGHVPMERLLIRWGQVHACARRLD